MRVVVAPDKFKGSATAAEVAGAIAAGLRAGRPDLDVVEVPVADGGDGTVAAAVAAGFAPVQVTAEGPTGEPVQATFALLKGTAVIELAEVAGLRRLPVTNATGSGRELGGAGRESGGAGRDDAWAGREPGGAGRELGGVGRDDAWAGRELAPLTASTYGLGQLVATALDRGATTIVLGAGGSASTDGGAGMMQALGLRLTDRRGQSIGRGGAALGDLKSIDLTGLDERLAAIRVLVASDVDNPLLGPAGAAQVFGPQKGASPGQVEQLDQALTRWAGLTASAVSRDVSAIPGAGAAGGTGFAALAYLGAQLMPGIDLVLALIGFDAKLAGAGLVITGEGSLDVQTLGGKAPVGVARAAARRGIPVAAVAGQVLLTDAELAAGGFAAAYPLTAIEPDPALSIARAVSLLSQVGRQIADSKLVVEDGG
jgi:glycerate kinase